MPVPPESEQVYILAVGVIVESLRQTPENGIASLKPYGENVLAEVAFFRVCTVASVAS